MHKKLRIKDIIKHNILYLSGKPSDLKMLIYDIRVIKANNSNICDK